jgi:hypothetical protein
MYLLRIVNDSDYYGILANRAILLEDINYKYYIYNFDTNKISRITCLDADVTFLSVNITINNLHFKKQMLGIEINTGFDDFIEFINSSKGIDKINDLFLQIHESYYDDTNYDKDKLEIEYIKELELAKKLDLEKLFMKSNN